MRAVPVERPRMSIESSGRPHVAGGAVARPRLRAGDQDAAPRLGDGARPHVRLDEGSLAPWSTGQSYRGRIDFDTPPVFSVIPTPTGKELWMGTSGSPVPGAGTFFMGSGAADLDPVEVEMDLSAGSLTDFRVSCAKPPGVGNTWVFTVMKNGQPTAMSCAVAGTSRKAAYTAAAVTFAAGDVFTIRREATITGAPAPLARVNWTAIFDPS